MGTVTPDTPAPSLGELVDQFALGVFATATVTARGEYDLNVLAKAEVAKAALLAAYARLEAERDEAVMDLQAELLRANDLARENAALRERVERAQELALRHVWKRDGHLRANWNDDEGHYITCCLHSLALAAPKGGDRE